MSGGVDSSVAASLLVEQGYDVTGAYMKQWSDGEEIGGVCPWKVDRRDAMRVCAHLGISLVTLDFEKEYKEWVMGYMFSEYEKGKTPNPDVMCNKFIKFGAWLGKARELGFDYLATGHYAKTENGKLLKAKDKEKDQTYFLNQITKKQLENIKFPLGNYTKEEVRELAHKYNLPTADRAESMGICFVGEVPIKEFLQQKIKKNPGNIISSDGRKIGSHEGLMFYTIGQRNFGVQSSEIKQKPGENRPLYIIEKRTETNELVVGFDDDPKLFAEIINLENIHYISGHTPDFPLECKVRLRHRQPLQDAVIDDLTITFKNKQKAVTPGQFAVIYKDEVCLGGGAIV